MTGANTKVQAQRKTKVGRVVSDKMDKTIVVSVERLARHRLYKRVIRLSTKFKAHDESNDARIGDTVLIEESRPLSATKRWRLVSVVQRAGERALKLGVGLKDVLEMVRAFRRGDADTPLVLMGYANPIEAMGTERFLAAAAEAGVDGVIVAGCLEGGCHFVEGNLRARKRVERTKQLLTEIGMEPERVEMYNLSSAEGTRFAELVTEMHGRLEKLGPSPLRRDAATVEENVREMAAQAEVAIQEKRNDCCRS